MSKKIRSLFTLTANQVDFTKELDTVISEIKGTPLRLVLLMKNGLSADHKSWLEIYEELFANGPFIKDTIVSGEKLMTAVAATEQINGIK